MKVRNSFPNGSTKWAGRDKPQLGENTSHKEEAHLPFKPLTYSRGNAIQTLKNWKST